MKRKRAYDTGRRSPNRRYYRNTDPLSSDGQRDDGTALSSFVEKIDAADPEDWQEHGDAHMGLLIDRKLPDVTPEFTRDLTALLATLGYPGEFVAEGGELWVVLKTDEWEDTYGESYGSDALASTKRNAKTMRTYRRRQLPLKRRALRAPQPEPSSSHLDFDRMSDEVGRTDLLRALRHAVDGVRVRGQGLRLDVNKLRNDPDYRDAIDNGFIPAMMETTEAPRPTYAAPPDVRELALGPEEAKIARKQLRTKLLALVPDVMRVAASRQGMELDIAAFKKHPAFRDGMKVLLQAVWRSSYAA